MKLRKQGFTLVELLVVIAIIAIIIALFKCPTDPNNSGNLCEYAGGGWARGNYGMNVSPCSFNSFSQTEGARSHLGGIGGANYSVRLRQIRDGASKTVAVDEIRAGLNPNDIRGCWAMPGLAAGTSALFGDANAPNSSGGNSDDMENCQATGLAGDGSQGMGCFDSKATGQMGAKSMHPGGLHVMMVGASVHFISNEIESKGSQQGCGPLPHGVWQALHTRGGREVVNEF